MMKPPGKPPGKPLYPVLVAAMLAATVTQAQVSKPPAQSVAATPAAAAPKFNGPGGLGVADTRWMQQRAHDAIFEFEASKLAKQKASSVDLRKFAQRVVDDNARSGAVLRDIAHANEVLLPEHPDAAQRAALDRLRSLNGAAFDAAYLNAMRTANRHDLAAEGAEARVVHNRALMKYVHERQKMDQAYAQSAARLQPDGTASRKK